ncbi:MAG: tetratricopeptide repeat protein [Planctomycetes bacterium]|nr:tetratricopeptide repeat protein [Planctomycetota bacterium]
MLVILLAGGFAAVLPVHGQESRPAAASAPGPQDVMAQAMEELDQGRYSKALDLLTSIRPTYKDDSRYYLALGRGYLGLKDYAIAIGAFKAAIEREKDLVEAHLRLAICYGCSGRAKEAMDELEKAVRLDQSDSRLHYASGLVRSQLRQWDQAEDAMRTAEKIGGPFIDLVKKKRETVEGYQQVELQAAKKRRDAIDAARQAHDLDSQALATGKDGITRATADRQIAEKKYKEDRQPVQKIYDDLYLQIMAQYAKDKPPESLKETDPLEYRRRLADVNAVLTASLFEAARARDKAFAEIDRAYKPIVETIDATLRMLQKKYPEDAAREGQSAKKLAQAEAEDKNYVPKPPFDLALALRDIPVDMGRRPTSQPSASQPSASRPASGGAGP